MKKLIGPHRRVVESNYCSECDSADLNTLDWNNWWTDGSFGSFYLHVRRVDTDDHNDETWHRVYPKPIRGHTCKRVAVFSGVLFWLHDKTKPTTKTK